MENSYVLAKKLVSNKYKSNDSLYQIMLVAFTTLFYKYKDYSDIVEKVFNDTDVFISKESVKEILERENINIVSFSEEENVIDNGINKTYGISSLGKSYCISEDDFKKVDGKPFLVVSSNCSKTLLLNTIIHEFNHLIKSYINSVTEDKFLYTIRCGVSLYQCRYDKKKDILYEYNYFDILDEVINTLQTTEMVKNILMLDGIVDDDTQKYIDSLNKDSMQEDFGYDISVRTFKPLWNNSTFRSLIEDNIVEGNIKYIMDEFDRILGSGSFITFTDLLDDLDEEDNGKRNNRKINKIRNKIKNIIIRYNSETQNVYKK